MSKQSTVGCLFIGGVGAIIIGLVLVGGLLISLLTVMGMQGNGFNASAGANGGNPCGGLSSSAISSSVGTVLPSIHTSTRCIVPPTQIAAQVVALVYRMADALSVNQACRGIISYPNCYYTWYTAGFPHSVLAYGQAVCPGCWAWANGTYQCVSFVRGAYGPIYPLVWTANAFDLWAVYQGKSGWQEVPANAAPVGQRGLPLPGDVMVFKDASVGHVAIVMAVVLPQGDQPGSVTFANANSVSPFTTMPLLPDLSVDASSWPGYTVWGYIRPALPVAGAVTSATE